MNSKHEEHGSFEVKSEVELKKFIEQNESDAALKVQNMPSKILAGGYGLFWIHRHSIKYMYANFET
jgi:hypothetical protein